VGAGAGTRNAIEANDNYFIHAWGPTGTEPLGFPKYTGQWTGFAGAVGDPGLNGHLQLVYGTREGDLFRWNVAGNAALNNSWWHARHDEWNTGQYGLDTRPPAPAARVSAHRTSRGRVTVSFIAPGGDWMSGHAAAYGIRYASSPISAAGFASAIRVRGVRSPARAGTVQRLRLAVPAGARYVAIRAIDAAGNLGDEITVPIR